MAATVSGNHRTPYQTTNAASATPTTAIAPGENHPANTSGNPASNHPTNTNTGTTDPTASTLPADGHHERSTPNLRITRA
ncbi:hypothetical protein GCM10009555_052240 [Acrocarpospora macrocephala]